MFTKALLLFPIAGVRLKKCFPSDLMHKQFYFQAFSAYVTYCTFISFIRCIWKQKSCGLNYSLPQKIA